MMVVLSFLFFSFGFCRGDHESPYTLSYPPPRCPGVTPTPSRALITPYWPRRYATKAGPPGNYITHHDGSLSRLAQQRARPPGRRRLLVAARGLVVAALAALALADAGQLGIVARDAQRRVGLAGLELLLLVVVVVVVVWV